MAVEATSGTTSPIAIEPPHEETSRESARVENDDKEKRSDRVDISREAKEAFERERSAENARRRAAESNGKEGTLAKATRA